VPINSSMGLVPSQCPSAILSNFGEMRFRDKNHEASFKLSCEGPIAHNGSMLFAFAACMAVFSIISEYNVAAEFAWEVNDPRTLFLVFMFMIFFVSLMLVICMQVHMRYSLFAASDLERIVLDGVVFLIFCERISGKSNLAFIYGIDPAKAWGGDPSHDMVTTFLCLTSLSTIICLFIPIRSHRLWLAPCCTSLVVLGAALIEAMSVHGGGHPFCDALLASGLSIWSYTAARRNERHARENFCAESVARESEAKLLESSGMVRALRAVGSALCDVVIALDGHNRIYGEDHKRDELFGRQTSGVLLRDLLLPEDGQDSRFERVLETAITESFPQLMPFIFQGRSGPLYTQLLVVATDVKDPRYLIGVQARESNLQSGVEPFCDEENLSDAEIGMFPKLLGATSSGDEEPPSSAEDTRFEDTRFASIVPSQPDQACGSECSFDLAASHACCSECDLPTGQACRSECSFVCSPGQAWGSECSLNLSQSTRSMTATPFTSHRMTQRHSAIAPEIAHVAVQTCEVQWRPPPLPGTLAALQHKSRRPSGNDRSRSRGRSRSRKGSLIPRSCSSSPDRQQMLSQFTETPFLTILFALTGFCKSMNFVIHGHECCAFHTALASLQRAIEKTRSLSCARINDSAYPWQPNDGWQCAECCALNDSEPESCEMCGSNRVCDSASSLQAAS